MPDKSTVRVIVSAEVRAWVDAQAEDMGCDAATWITMLVVQARKLGLAPPAPRVPAMPQFSSAVPSFGASQTLGQAAPPDDDAWRGPVEDEQGEASSPEVDAIIERRLAEAAAANTIAPVLAPVEVFGRAPQQAPAGAGSVRALVRPAPKYSPGAVPAHLAGLG